MHALPHHITVADITQLKQLQWHQSYVYDIESETPPARAASRNVTAVICMHKAKSRLENTGQSVVAEVVKTFVSSRLIIKWCGQSRRNAWNSMQPYAQAATTIVPNQALVQPRPVLSSRTSWLATGFGAEATGLVTSYF